MRYGKVSTCPFLFLNDNLCCSYRYLHKAEHSGPDPAEYLLYLKAADNVVAWKAVLTFPQISSPLPDSRSERSPVASCLAQRAGEADGGDETCALIAPGQGWRRNDVEVFSLADLH